MAIRFFIEYNKVVSQLPVNPEELVRIHNGANKLDEIIGVGEINIIRKRKLADITITSFFPANPDAPYVLTKGKFEPPSYYIELINKIREDKQPFRLIVSDTDINTLVTIENFEFGIKAGTNDVDYTLKIKTYQPYGAKKVNIVATEEKSTVSVQTTKRTKTGFAINDLVVVNGKYWYNSYGAEPFGTFTNFTGKISHIVADTTRAYRYHITTPDGGYRGWVAASQLSHV